MAVRSTKAPLSRVVALALLSLVTTAMPKRARADAACIDAANAAQTSRRDGRLLAARTAAAACSQAECPDVVKDECAKVLASLAATIPSIVVRVVDEEGGDWLGAKVTLDGVPIPIDGLGRELDPGAHVVVVESTSDHEAKTMPIVLGEGEKRRAVSVVIPRRAPPAGPGPAVSGSAVPSPSGRSLALPIALFGIGAASLGTAIAFHVSGLRRESDLEGSCAPRCAPGDVDPVRTRYAVAGVLYAVTGVAATSGLVALALGREKAGAHVAVAPSGLWVRGSF